MILLSDPRVARVAVAECGEPLVDLRNVPRLRLERRQADPAGAFALVREGLLRRLLAAQADLAEGLQLVLIEGYRPPHRQQAIVDGYRNELSRLHPEWPEERLLVETSKFVSPVAVAPHSTGGAVDLTLADAGGTELDLGTPVDATPEASRNACFTAARNISRRARANRRVLQRVLSAAGLVNYPTEWWHWSYGDRYWALLTGATAARYGPLAPPEPAPAPADPRTARTPIKEKGMLMEIN